MSESFWGKENSTKKAKPKKDATRQKTFMFDWRWCLLFVGLIVVIVVAIAINNNHVSNDTSKLTNTVDVDNGDQKINWNRYATTDVNLSESYEITKAGVYHFTGTLKDGYISINVSKDEPVKIILENVTIINLTGPAIACSEADNLVIELVGENTLEDGSEYDASLDSDVRATIYSKADTTFQGEGSLNITGHKEEAIVSKDDLKFISGTYNINSADDGIRGTDSVYITGGNFDIVSGADAIKSTNDTDSGKGFVLIEDGDFVIDAGAKGIKALRSLIIYGGNYNIKSYDDAIHTDNYIGIVGGEITIDSGDDGVHANKELIIDDGKINITNAYEGLEAQVVTINGGEISLTTIDDGINAGGGADASATNRKGAGAFDADLDCVLAINGGNVYVNAAGDGIDSNGYLYINGGNVTVDGPTNNGNGAIDAGASVIMNGGEAVAVGASGMAVDLGQTSSVYNISLFFTAMQSKDTVVEIKNSSNETVVYHKSAKTFSHMSAGSDKFKLGETYIIYINGEKYQDFTITGIVTTIGNGNQNPQNMMHR